jgi:hypothetical protein
MPTNFPTSVDNFTNPTANDSLNLPSHSTQHANANDAIEAVEDYLLNGAGKSGLVLLRSQNLGTGVSSVTVSDAFNTNYNNYRIVFSNTTGSGVNAMLLTFGSASTAYYGSQYYDSFNGGVTGTDRLNNAAFMSCGIVGVSNGDTSTNFDVTNPFLASRTMIHGTYYANVYSGWFGGVLANTTSYTSFTITPNAGTFTGGTIRVYGYRNA